MGVRMSSFFQLPVHSENQRAIHAEYKHDAPRKKAANPAFARLAALVGLVGLEPMTSTMSKIPKFRIVYNLRCVVPAFLLRPVLCTNGEMAALYTFICTSCSAPPVSGTYPGSGNIHPRRILLSLSQKIEFPHRQCYNADIHTVHKGGAL